MIRTRDFAIFLGVVLFLVTGITVSTVREVAVLHTQSATVLSAGTPTPPVGDLIAEPAATATLDRAASLEAMRAKIAALGSTPYSEPVATDVVDAPETTPDGADLTISDTPVTLCANYRVINPPGLGDVAFKEVEGALIVYRTEMSLVEPVTDPSASATAALPPMSESREVAVLQLPLRTAPLATRSCIPYDVVGIATDGSYIRNNEFAAYAVFPSDTLIGYALDGFPIYGVNRTASTDACGGAAGFDTYRYYLSTEREGVLGCFSGVPIVL